MLHLMQALTVALFPALVIAAALRDVTSYTIPNTLSLALLAAFPLAALLMGLPLTTMAQHLGVGVLGLLAGMAMFAFGWIGGGDAKLFAAAALWLGWPAAASYAAFTGLAGGGLALALLTLRSGYLRPYVVTGPAWFSRLAEPGENVPYGAAIAVGALAAFPASPFMHAFTGF